MKNTHYNIKDFAPCSNEVSSSHIPIDRIIVGKGRYRKDLGDNPSFANEISKIGLLHPIVVNEDHKLICGLRRIEACNLQDKSGIPGTYRKSTRTRKRSDIRKYSKNGFFMERR